MVLETRQARTHAVDLQTAQLQFATDCKTAFSQMPSTIAHAADFFTTMNCMHDQDRALDAVVSRYTLGRHALVVDSALDALTKQRIEEGRGVSFFGAGFSSDESPPDAPRLQ